MPHDNNVVPAGFVRPNWWDRNKGMILGGLAITAIAVAGTQIYARKQDRKFINEHGLADEYNRWLTSD